MPDTWRYWLLIERISELESLAAIHNNITARDVLVRAEMCAADAELWQAEHFCINAERALIRQSTAGRAS